MEVLPTYRRTSQRAQKLFGRFPLRWAPWAAGVLALFWLVSHAFHPPPPPPRDFPDWHYDPEPFFSPAQHEPGEEGVASAEDWAARAALVRGAFVHAYQSYNSNAYMHDEVKPVSGGWVNNFNGWSVTVFDSLDTMLIMGLDEMFDDALSVVARTSFYQDSNNYAPFFETVIRYLGGLLSAYAISREPILLARADDLGAALLPAMDTPSGLPIYAVNTQSGKGKIGWTGTVLWAEALSCQMEYKYLAHLTGRPQYYHKVEKIMDIMHKANVTDDLFSTQWDMKTAAPKSGYFSVGAFADSAHEYLLKQWLLTGQSEPKARDLYLRSMRAIFEHVTFVSPKREMLYVTDIRAGKLTHTFEHLTCFFAGLLALGAHTLELPAHERQLHRWAAEGLASTCWMTYADSYTGLGPDVMSMDHFEPPERGKWLDRVRIWEEQGRPTEKPPGVVPKKWEEPKFKDYRSSVDSYLLRPETVESFYLLWRTTGDPMWRERGWAVFQSIERFCKTKYGYASIIKVDAKSPTLKDEQPSYFLAETLKYLYLLFTDAELVPLNKWVFNTEGHPLPIYEWRQWEKDEYRIPTPHRPNPPSGKEAADSPRTTGEEP
ncbi:glycoside hydrolase family 47 protein [Schizophyllum commune]